MRVLALHLLIFVATVAIAGGAEFSERVIDTGFSVEQPVLVGDLAEAPGRQLVLAGRDDEHRQYLAIYDLDDPGVAGAEPMLTMNPPPRLIAYDVGQLGERDDLFFIEPGRILRYNLEERSFAEIVQIRTIYGQNRTGNIVPIDFIRDINLDGRDDLIVPDTVGYRVRLQRADGTLGDETILEDSNRMTVTDGIVSFESRPLYNADMNADGLSDLIVWRGNALQAYLQRENLRFEEKPVRIELGLGLLSEAELLSLQGAPGSVDQSSLSERRIFAIEDRNGDRLPDLLIESTESRGVFDKRNDFYLHLGRLSDGQQLGYDEAEDSVLRSDGLQYGLVTTDIDGDGKQDLLVRDVRFSFSRVIRALLSGNVPLKLHFFRMREDGRYGRKANYESKTNVRFSLSTGHMDIPAIQIADFDADGLQDFVMQTDDNELSFFHGEPTPRLFADDAVSRRVPLPRNGELVTAEDLNEDGRADLIIRYNAADGASAASSVRLLIARP